MLLQAYEAHVRHVGKRQELAQRDGPSTIDPRKRISLPANTHLESVIAQTLAPQFDAVRFGVQIGQERCELFRLHTGSKGNTHKRELVVRRTRRPGGVDKLSVGCDSG